MPTFHELEEEQKNKQRAVVRDLIGHDAYQDNETIDMVIKLEENHEGADKLDYEEMAKKKASSINENHELNDKNSSTDTDLTGHENFDLGETIGKHWDRYKRNVSTFGNYFKEGIKETALPAVYAGHRIGEVLFEPENLQGDAFENKMRGILSVGAYPDGMTPTYEESQWLWQNGKGKSISVERKLYDQLLGFGKMVGSPYGSFSEDYENLRVMGNENFPLEGFSEYDFEPFDANGYTPDVFFRNLLNKIAIAEHGKGQKFKFNFR